jgi:hypothetical protein
LCGELFAQPDFAISRGGTPVAEFSGGSHEGKKPQHNLDKNLQVWELAQTLGEFQQTAAAQVLQRIDLL